MSEVAPGLVTVFGGSGFVGSQVVHALARRGWRIRIACRRPDRAYKLQTSGSVGQIQAIRYFARQSDLPLTLGLVRDGVIDLARAFALLAANPAALLGVNAGRLAQGAEADLALIDPERPWLIDSGKMAAAAGNTPFDKLPVQGRVTGLFKGGAAIAL